MKKIYGNTYLLGTLDNMRKNNRLAQSVIFYGEKGSGKKLFADYYTSLLLCEAPDGDAPCGKCPACKTANSHSNPDVTYVPTEGKLEGYTVKIARAVSSDVCIKPNNNTAKKVYIFRDCKNMNVQAQNALLKLIEEPPEYACFIFTAESKSEFLPTIISRCVCFGVSPCTEEEARHSLIESGYKAEEAAEAIKCFHGNIGRCTSYIIDENLKNQVDLTKRIANSIIRKDEYELNASFFSIGSGRNDMYSILSMIDKLARDAAVLSRDANAPVIGCYREAAVRLSTMITAYQAVNIHNAIERACRAIDANVNSSLVLAGVCAEIMEIMA
ncbi:MAG: DNA polymerase III subunit delta' [Ruminococcus sp.]|nr:DNA polymerase III subunit delta' [Ruminococcus sp.]